MNSTSQERRCLQSDLVSALALGALDPDEAATVETHVAACSECRQEMAEMSDLVGTFAHWPTHLLRPAPSTWARLAGRIAADSCVDWTAPATRRWVEPDWEEIAPGITCQFLAADTDNARVSIIVRLAPGVEYPPHQHAGIEEVHLLDGELWIDDRKLDAGDYKCSLPGSFDKRVWTETGCTCVLVTSSHDVLS